MTRRRGAARLVLSLAPRLGWWIRALGRPTAYRRACDALVDAEESQLSESGLRTRRETIRERRRRGDTP